MKALLGLLVALTLASCGGQTTTTTSAASEHQLEQMLHSHPTFEQTVCHTVSQYGYQAALQAASRDWASQLQTLTPKQALDIAIAHCDD